MYSGFREIVNRLTAVALILLVASGAVQLFFANTYGQNAPPLFSVTLMACGSGECNSPRSVAQRQYASIVANNMIALGIDANVEYPKFSSVLSRIDFKNATLGAPFSRGGYDMVFLSGEGFYVPVPDYRSIFDGNPSYLPTVCPWESCFPDYSLYNSTQMNTLLEKLYTTTDTQTQVDLVHKWQEVIFNDSPYAYIYEPLLIVPRNQKWSTWGQKNLTLEPWFIFPADIQHFSGGNSFTLAVQYPFTDLYDVAGLRANGTLNPALTPTSANLVEGFIWGPIIGLPGPTLLDIDARDLSTYPALATNVTSSSDGLDWTVQIGHGALFQSGVEITADDFVWSRWAFFNPKTNSVFPALMDIPNLGNVIDFTFLNGTTVTVDHRASSDEPVRHGWWRAVDRYSFQFHLSQPYPFTRQVYVGSLSYPLPKHIMEKFPPETWDSQPFSTASGPYTYTWNVAQYGGNGSYTAVGPVGAGPYYLQSYNFTTNVATLKKFHQYWNATGLESIGQFTVDTYRVVVITDRQQAFEAIGNGTVDQLDGNYYGLSGSDLPTLKGMGLNVVLSPEAGSWRELGFNMMNPVWGTGVDTPLGMSNPALAAEAARHVRKAISHLIPRDQIVNEMLGGAAVPMASFLSPGWGIWYDKDLKPDSYDNNTAAAELRAAGYTVGGISTLAPTQSSPFWLIGGFVAAVGVTSSIIVVVRKKKREPGEIARRTLPIGYAELEGLLHGGIPVGYSVLLISPPCDERDLLMRKMLKSNLSSGLQVFYVSGDIGRTQELVRSSPTELYGFCPEAHGVASSERNLFEIPGIGNLVEFNILLNKGLSERAGEGKGKVIVMDLLSDLLYRHKAAVTRKWLTEFIAKRKAQGFTTICTLNPAMASKEEIDRILDLFDGIIEIYEKTSEAGLKRFLAIRKMYGQDYSESELLLERSKLL